MIPSLIKSIFAIVSMVFFIQCSQKVHTNDLNDEFLAFGSFGGFAGSYEEYRIYPNGKVYFIPKLNGNPIEKASLTSENFTQFKEILNALKKEKYILTEPGNMNHFIRFIEKNNKKFELIWEEGRSEPTDRVSHLFDLLNTLCKDRNPVM